MAEHRLDPEWEKVLRAIHASPNITMGTTMPFQLGRMTISHVGFADIPMIGMEMWAPSSEGLTAIVRQQVYAELKSAGISHEVIAFTPSVGRGRRRKFVDCNQSSLTLGKNKMGYEWLWHFEITRSDTRCFIWPSYSRGQLPRRRLQTTMQDLLNEGKSPEKLWVYMPDSREGFPHVRLIVSVEEGKIAVRSLAERFQPAALRLMASS